MTSKDAGALTGLVERMEALLMRLEAVADSLSGGPGEGAVSDASVQAYEELVKRLKLEQAFPNEAPPIAD